MAAPLGSRGDGVLVPENSESTAEGAEAVLPPEKHLALMQSMEERTGGHRRPRERGDHQVGKLRDLLGGV